MQQPVVTLESMFSDEERATEPPDALVARILTPTTAPDVESVWFSSTVQADDDDTRFRCAPGFGIPVPLPTGETLYVRVRSSIGTTFIKPVFDSELEANETREITFLIVCGPRSSRPMGAFNQLLAVRRPTHTPQLYACSATKGQVVNSSASYGSNVWPIVFLSHYCPRKRGLFSLMDHAAILTGSTTFTDAAGSGSRQAVVNGRGIHVEQRSVPPNNRIQRGLSILTVAEWVANVARLEERDEGIVTPMTQAQFDSERQKTVRRVDRALAAARDAEAHAKDGELPAETCSNFADTVFVGRLLTEFGTLGGIVDRIACGAFEGVLLKSVEMPRSVPLYLSACVLLATYLPCEYPAVREDRAAAESIVGVVNNLVGCHHVATGVLSTSFAGLVEAALSEATSEETDITPAMELMRRQGAALLQELSALQPVRAEEDAQSASRSFLGQARFAAARDRVLSPIVQHAKNATRASGVTGSETPHELRLQRVSSRAQMQRVVISMMLNVNEYCATGFFRGRRYAPQNTSLEDTLMGPACGVARNRAASQAVVASLIEMFHEGPRALVPLGVPILFPLRARTRSTCTGCAATFDPRTCLARGLLSGCTSCKRRFCPTCYAAMARTIKSAGGSACSSDAFIHANPALLQCVSCRASKRGPR